MENFPLQAGKDVIGKIWIQMCNWYDISIRQVFIRAGQGKGVSVKFCFIWEAPFRQVWNMKVWVIILRNGWRKVQTWIVNLWCQFELFIWNSVCSDFRDKSSGLRYSKNPSGVVWDRRDDKRTVHVWITLLNFARVLWTLITYWCWIISSLLVDFKDLELGNGRKYSKCKWL